ncbi:MAG: redoxin domain-containing protein [Thermomicrobiales bacterium]|nr:redoxin domain-containing protein [Thermomicrobiales bacterium]
MRPRLISVVILLSVVLAGCGGGGDKSVSDQFGLIDWPTDASAATGPQVGDRAPNFKLETPDGQTVELAQYAGQPVFLNFFASWCANCREEMAAFEAESQSGTIVIGIDYRESAETVTKLAAETGATFPIGLDRDTEVSREGFKVTNLPATILIDADGIIRSIVRGPIDDERIEELKLELPAATAGGA